MKEQVKPLALELPIAAACWLALAAQRFALPSQSKVLRCCIEYASQAEGAAGLLDGALRSGGACARTTVLEVAVSQIAWLQSVDRPRGDAARAAAGVVLACIARFPHVGAAESIFATNRWQTGATARGSASDALAATAPSARDGALGNLFDAAAPGAEGGALHALLCPDRGVDSRAPVQLPSCHGLWDAVFGVERSRERPLASLLPQLVARATATVRERAFWSHCEHHSLFQVYTREFIAAVLECIVDGAGAAAHPGAGAAGDPRREVRRSVTVLEVGAGDGRFSAALLREARRRWGGRAAAAGGTEGECLAGREAAVRACTVRAVGRAGAVFVRFVATDSGRDRIASRSDAAPPVARVAAERALASIEGDGDVFVLCAWMPQGVDWTRCWCVRALHGPLALRALRREFTPVPPPAHLVFPARSRRADARVSQYLLVGPADGAACGDVYATWGVVPSAEFAAEYGIDSTALAPHAREGFARREIDGAAGTMLCRFDHGGVKAGESVSRAIVFQRRV